ncbi:MAG: protein-glutamate O-methyltransferase CheR [Candidatus Omnitrophota bacterium]
MNELDFKFLLEKIHRNKGVDFSSYRSNTLKRRIDARLRDVGCKDYSDYVVYLNENMQEYDKLIEELTINVTEFFRNPESFAVLGEKIIPEIIEAKRKLGKKNIRAWSAGSSFGEETYSIAVLFMEALKDKIPDFDIVVYGTDIDPACVEKAKLGVYNEKSLKEINSEMLKKYFSKQADNYIVNENVKRLARFKTHNLVSDEFLQNIDLILCRNVVIYFSKPLQERVYLNFYRVLNKDGFLMLGKVESLWGLAQKYFSAVDNRERVYRKISNNLHL